MSKRRMRPESDPSAPATGLGPVEPPYPHGIRELAETAYDVRFARTADDLERVQRLRYEVFNVELKEGLAASAEPATPGRDPGARDLNRD